MDREIKSTSRAVERALAIVEAFTAHDRMSCRDVARRLQIPKTTAWYILRTLELQGYLLREAQDGRYRLTMKMATFGQSLTEKRIKRLGIPVLLWLKEQTHLSTGLASSGWILHCALPGMRPEEWQLAHNESYSSPCAKLSLAYRSESEMLMRVERHQLKERNSVALTNLSALTEELAKVREQGYTVDDERTIRGLRFVSAPVFGVCGHLKGSIGAVGFLNQVPDDKVTDIGAAVKHAARLLMQQLNHPDQSCSEALETRSLSQRDCPRTERILELPAAHYSQQA